MIVIGVTGGVGTGKSTVAKMLQELGAVVLDADTLAHEAMEPKRLAWRQIIALFGDGVLNEDQTIDRRELGRLVFSDAQARQRLEAVIHPQVFRRIKQQLHRVRRRRGVRAVVLDVPLLVETDAQELADLLVVVTATEAAQRRRLHEKYGWSQEEITQRIAAQWNLSAKAALADYVVDNGNGLEHTRKQVRQIWNQAVTASHRN
jgi:dephospho-CoA kinase